MREKSLTLCYIIFAVIFQVFGVAAVNAVEVKGESSKKIISHCDTIKEDLKRVQKEDARVRVALGGYYEAILADFITPLNVRLVENNLSNARLVENQNDYVETRALFASDFIVYQQGLEELVGMDCKDNPDEFYNKLQFVRQKRKIVSQDVLKMRSLISEHVKLVGNLKSRL